MLKIRLQRVGRKHDPSFRVVLLDSRRGPKTGNFLEILGSYDARKGEPQIDGERVKHWISKGAQTSDTLNNLLVSLKIIDGKKKDVRPKMTVEEKKVEEVKEEVKDEPKTEETKEEVKPEEAVEKEEAETKEEKTEEPPKEE